MSQSATDVLTLAPPVGLLLTVDFQGCCPRTALIWPANRPSPASRMASPPASPPSTPASRSGPCSRPVGGVR